jgi:hypothetical protein
MLEHFPDPHPDEILYSVWSRFSDCVCYLGKQDVMRELFGNINAVTIVDLPCFLGHFVNNLPLGHAYTIDDLINHHTLFPLYAPFYRKIAFVVFENKWFQTERVQFIS